MESTLEVFTTRRSRREAHRQWPDELRLRDFHPAVFGFPVVKSRLRNPMSAAQVGGFRPCFLLLQHRNDLFFRKSLLLHSSVLNGPDSNQFWRKFSVAGHAQMQRPQ